MNHRPPAASLLPAHLPSLRAALRWPLVLLAVFLALLTCGAVLSAAASPRPAAPGPVDLESLGTAVHESLSRAASALGALLPPAAPDDAGGESRLRAAWELVAGADHQARAILRSTRLTGSAPAPAVDRILRLVDRDTGRARGLLKAWERRAAPAGNVASALERLREESDRALAILREARAALRARGLRPALPGERADRSTRPEGDEKIRIVGSGCPNSGLRPR
jgi:hypothetical protein